MLDPAVRHRLEPVGLQVDATAVDVAAVTEVMAQAHIDSSMDCFPKGAVPVNSRARTALSAMMMLEFGWSTRTTG